MRVLHPSSEVVSFHAEASSISKKGSRLESNLELQASKPREPIHHNTVSRHSVVKSQYPGISKIDLCRDAH